MGMHRACSRQGNRVGDAAGPGWMQKVQQVQRGKVAGPRVVGGIEQAKRDAGSTVEMQVP